LKVIVAQIGAREHYAVARAFCQLKMLTGLVTDWYAFGKHGDDGEGSRRKEVGELTAAFRPLSSLFWRSVIRRPSAFAARCERIPDRLVHAFPFRSLLWKWRVRRLAAQGRSYDAYLQTDRRFAVALSRLKLPQHEVFFGYSYASLEMMEMEKKRGVLTVLGQIDPGAAEFQLVAEEMIRLPKLAGLPHEFPSNYYERNRREWKLADIILVNSEWSRELLLQQGAPAEKLAVIPLCYESEIGDQKPEVRGRKLDFCPLRILWLGQVIVRKGIYYLMEAARLLRGENVHFDLVGPISITGDAVKSAPANMTFHGPVSRDRVAEWYRQSDLFVLPTLSDGFALTQLEAMAHGLPLIVTPNCGRVVSVGKTGFIVPPRDSEALAAAILRFVHQPDLASEMAPACLEAVKAYSSSAFGQQLLGILKQHKTAAMSCR